MSQLPGVEWVSSDQEARTIILRYPEQGGAKDGILTALRDAGYPADL